MILGNNFAWQEKKHELKRKKKKKRKSMCGLVGVPGEGRRL
jgi:hypothetical protein